MRRNGATQDADIGCGRGCGCVMTQEELKRIIQVERQKERALIEESLRMMRREKERRRRIEMEKEEERRRTTVTEDRDEEARRSLGTLQSVISKNRRLRSS